MPLNHGNHPSVNARQEEIVRLQSSNEQMKSALNYIFHNVVGNVPSEFANLIKFAN